MTNNLITKKLIVKNFHKPQRTICYKNEQNVDYGRLQCITFCHFENQFVLHNNQGRTEGIINGGEGGGGVRFAKYFCG